MTINLHLPSQMDTLKPKITVVGVGGAGQNAVNNMIAANLEGVDFVIANTDAQALDNAMTDRTIQLGATITRGLGAGANPDIGRAAAEETIEEIAEHIEGSNMVFITAGMGGGTGTGAAPVVAQMAREQGILTVGVVTKPFHFEGTHRMRMAESGIRELQQYVDTLIVIPNQNLFRIANEKTTFADAFRLADEVLHSGVRGVTDLIVKPGLVNLDFADIRTVMSEMGKAMMGTGEASGDKRAIDASEAAISNPLLDDVSLKGARAVLINITGGPDMTLFEVDEAANRIRDEVDPEANIIFGSTFHDAMAGKMRVSVIATGIDAEAVMNERPFQFGSSAEAAPKLPAAPRAPQAFAGIPARKQEMRPAAAASAARRERSAAEIVREAGTTSPAEMLRQSMQAARIEKEAAALAAMPADGQGELGIEENARRSPIRLGEAQAAAPAPTGVVDGKGGPMFVSPRAEQPVQRTAFTSQKPMRMDNESMLGYEPGMEEEEQGGLSFFQKIAGKGFLGGNAAAAPARAEARQPEPKREQPAPRAEIKPVANPENKEDEYLDIPAFLRRQAN